MLKKIVLTLTALAMFTTSTSALALFDAELRYGTRWYSYEQSDGEKANSSWDGITVAGHLGFIPFIGAGLSVSSYNMKDRDLGSLDSFTMTEVGIDVLVNPPIPFLYGRVNFPVVSAAEGKGKVDILGNDVEYTLVRETAAVGDMILGVGAEFSIIPLIAATIEANSGVVMQKNTEFKMDGGDNSAEGGAKGTSLQSVTIGVRVGL